MWTDLGDALPTRPTDVCRICGTRRPADELTTAEDARGEYVRPVCRADAPGPVACFDRAVLAAYLADCARRDAGATLEPDELALLWPAMRAALGAG